VGELVTAGIEYEHSFTRMMRTRSAVLAPGIAVLMATVSFAGKTGVAVVANASTARSVAELMLPVLSEDPNIALVEREHVDPLFKEIETALLSGGMRGISDKIRMFGTDVFAVLFSDEEIEGCSLTVFDAQSGIRLLDTALTSQDKGAQSKEAAEYVLQAVSKRKTLMRGDLQTISIVAFRNLDMPSGQAPFARAVSYLLEQLIVNAPGLTLLERRSLEWVNKERMLIPGSLSEKLKGGRVALEIEMAWRESAQKCRATVFVKSGAGNVIDRIEVQQEAEDPLRMAKAIFSGLAQAMDVSDSIASPDVEREADRLLWEYLYLRGHGNRHEALERMEASAALDPDHTFPYLASALLHAGYPPDTLQSLEYGERVVDILRTTQKHNPGLRMRRDTRAGISGSRNDANFDPAYFRSLFTDPPLSSPELEEKRRALMRSIVKLASERTRALGLYGYDSRYLTCSGGRPFRLALLFWIHECPEDIEAWFRHAVQNRDKNSKYGSRRSNLGYMGLFLERVANGGLRAEDPPVLDTVKRLWSLYQDMDVESTLFTVAENRRLELKLRADDVPTGKQQKKKDSCTSLMTDPRYAEDFRRCINKALVWLAGEQRRDGSWRMPEHVTDGKTATTSLALLAFLASGEGCPGGMYWPTVEQGLRFLVERDLRNDGSFNCNSEGISGLAALALIEAYLQIDDPALKEAARLAVGGIVKSQHEKGVIAGDTIAPKAYVVRVPAFCDMLTPLVLAEKYGMEVDGLRNAIRKASASLLNAYEGESGVFYDVIYPEGWKHRQRPTRTKAQANRRLLRSVYPVLILYSLGLSDTPEADSAWKAIKPLRPDSYSQFTAARYAATQLMFHSGGSDWREWFSRFFKILLESQHADGFWNKRDDVKQSSSGYYNAAGSVYKTAYNILSLSVPARNLAVHGSLPLIQVEPKEDDSTEKHSKPWISKRQLLENKGIVFVESDAKDIFIGQVSPKTGLSIDRISWSDFAHTALLQEAPANIHLYLRNKLSRSRATISLSADNLFVGHCKGVLIIPRNGDPIRQIRIKDELPLQSLTWMDGWIYAALGIKYRDAKIVRINTDNGQVETLLQSGQLGSDNPLENLSSPPLFRGMAADPARKRILLLIAGSKGGSARKQENLNGLWEYTVDNGQWQHLVPLNSTGLARMHSYGDYLLVGYDGSAIGYDLANDQPEVVWAGARLVSTERSRFEHSTALFNERGYVEMPHALIGDWFWGSEPFLRGNLKTGKIEKLPPLEKTQHMIAGANRERGYLLVATETGLWALKLKSASR
jgi:hypothetical protein